MTEQERISQIEQSLAGLERQLCDLKFEVKELKDSRNRSEQTVPVSQARCDTTNIQSDITTVASTPVSTATPQPAPVSTAVHKPVQPQTAAKQNKKTTSKFEENLGGKVMGIVAAVLVFVGLFLFGSMLYERLGDVARVAILFVVSFFILGLGLFLERKRKSWFTTSLVGCGFVAIYISLFLTALYFGMFEVEVLYILLFFWLLGTGLYVFLRQSFTVALLGQIGIAFSVIFGCLGIESEAQFTFPIYGLCYGAFFQAQRISRIPGFT